MARLSRTPPVAALGLALLLFPAGARAAGLPPAPAPVASFDAGTLHVDTYGSGPQTLILIPGLGSGSWAWYGTIAHFSPHYTIYAITLPGFDGRPATTKTPLFTTFAADFWQMLDDHKIAKPVVIGHSLGGTLAFLLGEQHPERLRGIVAVDGLPVFPTLAQATAQQRHDLAARVAASMTGLKPADWLTYNTTYMKTIGTRDPDIVAPAAQLEAKSDPKAEAAWMQEDLAADLRPNLAKIAIPVLEIMPYDPALAAKSTKPYTQAQSVAFYTALLAGAPNARVEPIVASRHFAMLDQPDAFYALVTSFLHALPAA